MLERILVVVHVVIVIVGIREEIIPNRKYVRRAHVLARQENGFRLAHHIYVARVFEAQIFAVLVAQVSVGVAVAHNLVRALAANGTVVGSDDELALFLGNLLHHLVQRRVQEPRAGNAAVGRFIGRQFPNHGHVGAGVRKHIHEVVDDNVALIIIVQVK